MRKSVLMFTIALACVVAPGAMADDAPSPMLTEEEHTELIRLLDESFDQFMGLITGLSEEQWTFKQNADRWSVGQCAEHIVRSEAALLDSALAAMANAPDSLWVERTKGKTQLLRNVMPNRRPAGQGGATAPQEIRPTENWDRSKTIAEFYAIRGKVRGYVETLERPVKNQTFEHPFPVFGWLSAHDWLIYVPLHTVRHSRQMIEVMEDPSYPKN